MTWLRQIIYMPVVSSFVLFTSCGSVSTTEDELSPPECIDITEGPGAVNMSAMLEDPRPCPQEIGNLCFNVTKTEGQLLAEYDAARNERDVAFKSLDLAFFYLCNGDDLNFSKFESETLKIADQLVNNDGDVGGYPATETGSIIFRSLGYLYFHGLKMYDKAGEAYEKAGDFSDPSFMPDIYVRENALHPYVDYARAAVAYCCSGQSDDLNRVGSKFINYAPNSSVCAPETDIQSMQNLLNSCM